MSTRVFIFSFLGCFLFPSHAQYVSFKSTTESLEIYNNTLNYTLTKYTRQPVGDNTKIAYENRIVFKNKALSKRHMRTLRLIIRKSNFFAYPTTSGATEKVQYFPETLTIKWKDKKHTLMHKSHPEYPPLPGYDKLKSEIFNWVDSIE